MWRRLAASPAAWGAASRALRRLGAASARRVVKGDRVQFKFQVFSATSGDLLVHSGQEAVDAVVGRGYMLPGIENRLLGMAAGESWSGVLPAHEGFGFKDPARIVSCVRPPNMDVAVGQGVQMGESGEWARVIEVGPQSITVDLNHPFAGQDVKIALELLDVRTEDVETNEVHVETLMPGDGKTFAKPGDRVHLHYTGTLRENGKEFDSSRKAGGKPFVFVMGARRVIPGMEQGVAQMSLGQRAMIHIPSALAYGEAGAQGVIPPNADINFDVHLVKIEKGG